MWGWIAQLLGGPLVNGLLNAYRAKLDAANTRDAQAVDLAKKEIEGEIAARQAEASIIRQEEGRWYTSLPRPLFAFIFIVYIGKCVIWDKVLGWGSTDPLGPELSNIEMIIVTGYFGGRTIEKVARIFKR